MYNKVILLGNLSKDVEIRYSQNGSAIGNAGIATNRKWKDKNGQQEEVMFIDLTFFGRTAEIANQYLRKGSRVLIEGRLTFKQWTVQDGTKRSKHVVTVENLKMLGGKTSTNNDSSTPNSTPAPKPQTQTNPTTSIPEIDVNQDEIPF